MILKLENNNTINSNNNDICNDVILNKSNLFEIDLNLNMNKYMFERMNCFLDFNYIYSLNSIIRITTKDGIDYYTSYTKYNSNQYIDGNWIQYNGLFTNLICESDLLNEINKYLGSSPCILFYHLNSCQNEVLECKNNSFKNLIPKSLENRFLLDKMKENQEVFNNEIKLFIFYFVIVVYLALHLLGFLKASL